MARYRLQALLEIRERTEEEAKEAFALATKKLHEEERVLLEAKAKLEKMKEDRAQKRQAYSDKLASGQMKVTDQAAADRYLKRLKDLEAEQLERIETQEGQVEEARQAMETAKSALVEATQDLKALQKHREKWAAQLRRERIMKEEDALDEIAQTIFQTRPKE